MKGLSKGRYDETFAGEDEISYALSFVVFLFRLPMKKQRDSLKKVHTWYLGNRHTLQTGPVSIHDEKFLTTLFD